MKIYNVFHVDLLILHCRTEAYRETYHQPPPELIDGEEEYEIKKIIDQCTNKRRRKKQYLVSWIGYPASENSWVNESDLHALKLLQEYRLSKAWPLEYTVDQKTVPMFGCFAKIEVEQIKKIRK